MAVGERVGPDLSRSYGGKCLVHHVTGERIVGHAPPSSSAADLAWTSHVEPGCGRLATDAVFAWGMQRYRTLWYVKQEVMPLARKYSCRRRLAILTAPLSVWPDSPKGASK